MGTLKTTLKVESIDLFPTPVSFTKVNDNAIVLGASTFATLQLAAGLNTISTIPAGNAFMYLSSPSTNSGSINLSSVTSSGVTVDAFDQTTITQTLGAYEQSTGPVVNFTNLTFPNADYGQASGGVLAFDMFTITQNYTAYGQTSGPAVSFNINSQGPGPYEQSIPGPIFSLDPSSIVPGAAAAGSGIYLVTPTSLGSGSGATLYVEVNVGSPNFIFVNNPGDGYLPGEVLSIAAVDLGGVGAATTIVVDQINFGSSIYVASNAITSLGSGSGADLYATIGTAANGDPHKVLNLNVVPQIPGDLFDVMDTITIDGAALGGAAIVDNVTAIVNVVGSFGRSYVVPTTGGSGVNLNAIVTVGYDLATLQINSVIGVEVDPANPGEFYEPGDTITIAGPDIGGDIFSPVTIDVARVFGGGVYQVAPVNVTSGSGTGLGVLVCVGLDTLGNPLGIAGVEVDPTNPGDGYAPGDTVTITGNFAGGLVANVIQFDVDKIGLGSAITVAPANVAGGSGTGLGVIVSIGFDTLSNTPNSVIEISVDPANPGTGYLINDAITINGAALGGTTPADNVTVDISALNNFVNVFSTVEPGDTGFFPIGDGTGYTLQASPAVPGDSIQYFVGTR